jgi:RNA polymerase sigma-70 factor (ECF subfamily)
MNPDKLTSLSLLERVRQRDDQAWQRLVALYGPLVSHWCLRGGADREDVGDLAQEVFLAVAGGLDRFQHQRPGSFRSWMRGITRNKLLEYFRRQQGRPTALGGSIALQQLRELPDPVAGSTDETEEVSRLYHRALELMRCEFEERTWQAFWRTAVEGRDSTAVAAELNMTPTAVRVAKSRVLVRLRADAGQLIE